MIEEVKADIDDAKTLIHDLKLLLTVIWIGVAYLVVRTCF